MNQNTHNIIAIDIAKGSLQIQTVQESFILSNDDNGFAALLERIAKLKNPFVICEATGGYERSLVAILHHKRICVTVVNPSRVRAFAHSEGIKAKTDAIDAKMLFQFALEKNLQPTPPPEPKRQELAALLDRRSHLTEQLAREKNRLQKSPKLIATSIKRMIHFVEKEILSVDQQIRKTIDTDEDIKGQSQTLQSVKGVGEVTTWTILAYLSEIGHVGRNQLVALAGVAPFNRDSGKTSAKRSIHGGRAKVRKCLYMAAQTAAQHNPVIKSYVEGLIARGKPYKCAIVAAMRKLLIHLQCLLKTHHFSLAS